MRCRVVLACAQGRTNTEVAAQAAERTDRRRWEWIDPRLARTRLNELDDRWLDSNPASQPRTLQRDREIVSAAVSALGSSRRVVSVTRADVQGLVNNWRAELAPSTVRRMSRRCAPCSTTPRRPS